MLSTAKIIGSIDREIRALSSAVDTQATQFINAHSDADVTVRKMPERFIFQAKEFGVSVSFFRSRAGMDAGAEVVLAVWNGEITSPGCSPPHDRHAIRMSAQQFQLTLSPDDSWLWTDDATAETMSSAALATRCIETIAGRLSIPPSPQIPDSQ